MSSDDVTQNVYPRNSLHLKIDASRPFDSTTCFPNSSTADSLKKNSVEDCVDKNIGDTVAGTVDFTPESAFIIPDKSSLYGNISCSGELIRICPSYGLNVRTAAERNTAANLTTINDIRRRLLARLSESFLYAPVVRKLQRESQILVENTFKDFFRLETHTSDAPVQTHSGRSPAYDVNSGNFHGQFWGYVKAINTFNVFAKTPNWKLLAPLLEAKKNEQSKFVVEGIPRLLDHVQTGGCTFGMASGGAEFGASGLVRSPVPFCAADSQIKQLTKEVWEGKHEEKNKDAQAQTKNEEKGSNIPHSKCKIIFTSDSSKRRTVEEDLVDFWQRIVIATDPTTLEDPHMQKTNNISEQITAGKLLKAIRLFVRLCTNAPEIIGNYYSDVDCLDHAEAIDDVLEETGDQGLRDCLAVLQETEIGHAVAERAFVRFMIDTPGCTLPDLRKFAHQVLEERSCAAVAKRRRQTLRRWWELIEEEVKFADAVKSLMNKKISEHSLKEGSNITPFKQFDLKWHKTALNYLDSPPPLSGENYKDYLLRVFEIDWRSPTTEEPPCEYSDINQPPSEVCTVPPSKRYTAMDGSFRIPGEPDAPEMCYTQKAAQEIAWSLFMSQPPFPSLSSPMSPLAPASTPAPDQCLHWWLHDGNWRRRTHIHELAALRIQCAFRCFKARVRIAWERLRRAQLNRMIISLEEEGEELEWDITERAYGVAVDEAVRKFNDKTTNAEGYPRGIIYRGQRRHYERTLQARLAILRNRTARNQKQERDLQDYAAAAIQAYWRGFVVRHPKPPPSIIAIQRRWRGYIARVHIQRVRNAATIIAAAYARYRARRFLQKLCVGRRSRQQRVLQEFAARILLRFLTRHHTRCLARSRKDLICRLSDVAARRQERKTAGRMMLRFLQKVHRGELPHEL